METDLLTLLLRINLALAASIALVLVLRAPMRRFFGARVAYALWLLPLAAAAMCFVPGRIEHVVLQAAPVMPAMPAPLAPEDQPPYLLWAWASGAFLSLLVLAARQLRFTLALGRLSERADLGANVRAAETNAHGPAVIGVIRPVIVTPADFEARFDAEEQRIVLAHERAHMAQGDPWINAVVLCVTCLNWFNPFVHLGARALRTDQELACDAAVLERATGMRRRYAEAMLKTHIAQAAPLGCAWPPANVQALKERISMLKKDLPSRTQRLLGGAAIIAVTGVAAAAAWAAQPTRVVTTFEYSNNDAQVQRIAYDADADYDVDVDHDFDFDYDVALEGGEGAGVANQGRNITIRHERDNDGPTRRVITRNGEVISERDLTPEEEREIREAVEQAHRAAAEGREAAREAQAAAREVMREARNAQRHALTDAQRAEIREAARQANVQHRALSAAEREEIREAMAEAREAMRTVEMHQLSDEQQAHIRQAMEQARVSMDQARTSAEVSAASRAEVREAMAQARVQMAEARAQLAELPRIRAELAELPEMTEVLAEARADVLEEAREARAEGDIARAEELERAAHSLGESARVRHDRARERARNTRNRD